MRTSPLKVVRIITRLNIGGPAINAITLSAGLPPDRFRSVLVCGSPGPDEGDMGYLAEEKGVRPVVIPHLRRQVRPADDVRSLRLIIALIRQERPDIIHTHMSKAGLLGRIAAMRTPGVKTVHTFHGNVLSGYFSTAQSRIFLSLERWLARRTDRLVALSESQRREMLERYRVGRPEQYAVIPLGFDLERFSRCGALRGELRRELGIPRDEAVIAIVGRLAPIKDPTLFLAAARCIRERRPDAVFLVVGDGELRAHCEAEARGMGIARNVRFLGWRRDLERIYADADVVMLTSKNEGTPVSLIEASAAARPVVAMNVGGVADVVLNGESGLLAEQRDARRLADLALCLLDDPPRAHAMGEKGRAFALARYATSRLLGDIAALYEAMVATGP